MLSTLKNNKMLFFVNLGVAMFFLTLLVFVKGYNYAPVFMTTLGLGYLVYHLAVKKAKWSPSAQDKRLIFAYLLYFAVFLLSFVVHDEKANTLDNPAKILLFLPLLPLFNRFPIKFNVLLHAIPVGALLAGLTALYQRFVLNSPAAFSINMMHIQGGDIAMSLAMFSLVITFCLAIRKRYKLTALYFVFSLFGMAASFLSTARGGWIGVPFIILLIIWVYHNSLSKKILTAFFGVIALVIVGLAFTPSTKIAQRFELARNDISDYMEKGNGATSLGARFDMWKAASLAIREKPLLGWGEQGIAHKFQELAAQKRIGKVAATFDHAHNQYLDDLSKRGIIGFAGLLAVFLIPLALFRQHSKERTTEHKTIALLGIVHIISTMFYCLSQGFFTHNSGSVFYFFSVIIFYGALKGKSEQ